MYRLEPGASIDDDQSWTGRPAGILIFRDNPRSEARFPAKAAIMRDNSETDWDEMEDHCYFPEWADRPAGDGTHHEVNHNSYMAGGYAEEFGHRARSPPAQALTMLVENDGEWRVQIDGLHPGYPECPRPRAREPLVDGRSAGAGERPSEYVTDGRSPGESVGFTVVLVGQHDGARPRHRPWVPWREYLIRRRKLSLG